MSEVPVHLCRLVDQPTTLQLSVARRLCSRGSLDQCRIRKRLARVRHSVFRIFLECDVGFLEFVDGQVISERMWGQTAQISGQMKTATQASGLSSEKWSGREDSNLRPHGPELWRCKKPK